MANTRIILDTNIFIDHLRKVKKETSFLTQLAQKYTFSTTSISVYELLVGAKTPQHKIDIENLLFGVEIFPFDRQAAEIASEERSRLIKLNKQFEIRDIFIAGICLKSKLPLATLNEKHFKDFLNIKILNGHSTIG